MVNQDQKYRLITITTMEVFKEVVFSVNPTSVADPDGTNGYIFQKWWHIIKRDLLWVILAFFSCQMISKYFSHSCIVLLPNVSNPNKLTKLRTISLRNFTSKIISKLVSHRLSPILPSLISLTNQPFEKVEVFQGTLCLH